MRIALIDASPKKKGSVSGYLLRELAPYTDKRSESAWVGLHTDALGERERLLLSEAEVWVFSVGLYVDGLPSHLLRLLEELHPLMREKPYRRVCGIVNCGFYEGHQCRHALDVLQNACLSAGVSWSGGCGVGAVTALVAMEQYPPCRRLGVTEMAKRPIRRVLRELGERLSPEAPWQEEAIAHRYASVGIPRAIYRIAAESSWKQQIQQNGERVESLNRRRALE